MVVLTRRPTGKPLREIFQREIDADDTLRETLAELEERDDVPDVMALLDAHGFEFSWAPDSGLLAGCFRTQMNAGDTLTPLQARVVLEVWYDQITAYMESRAAHYGLPEGKCYLLRYRLPGERYDLPPHKRHDDARDGA